jgi:RNA polymerase sigma-70 factor, ECF subfamily
MHGSSTWGRAKRAIRATRCRLRCLPWAAKTCRFAGCFSPSRGHGPQNLAPAGAGAPILGGFSSGAVCEPRRAEPGAAARFLSAFDQLPAESQLLAQRLYDEAAELAERFPELSLGELESRWGRGSQGAHRPVPRPGGDPDAIIAPCGAMRDTDATLIERTGDGDPAAFEELYRRYAPAVLGMARRSLADTGRAEEVAQETFTAVWRSAARFRRNPGNGSAWIYTIARNAILNRARQRAEPVVELGAEVSTEAGPEESAEASWRTWYVHAALVQLPDNERSVLELAYWSGLSQTEIADELDVPLGTVKTRTRAGLTRLRELLNEVRA